MKIPGRLGNLLNECGRLLQVALDFIDPWKALETGIISLVGKPVILEAGTPLIKSYGMQSVKMLASIPGVNAVVADMKTMDTGKLETELAASYGADVVTVLSVAPDETIRSMVETGEDLGVAVYGDLIGHPEPIKRAEQLWELGVHVALFHIGIDLQEKLGLSAGERVETVKRLKEVFPGPIAVAGGIRPEEVSSLSEAGADIIIIGGAITRAENPRKAALEAYQLLGSRCS